MDFLDSLIRAVKAFNSSLVEDFLKTEVECNLCELLSYWVSFKVTSLLSSYDCKC